MHGAILQCQEGRIRARADRKEARRREKGASPTLRVRTCPQRDSSAIFDRIGAHDLPQEVTLVSMLDLMAEEKLTEDEREDISRSAIAGVREY
jgi:hypothetical protein